VFPISTPKHSLPITTKNAFCLAKKSALLSYVPWPWLSAWNHTLTFEPTAERS
jgi:hypothetical protein